MSEPIISPWFIYLLMLLPTIKEIAIVVAILSMLPAIIYKIGEAIIRSDGGGNEHKWKDAWGKWRWILPAIALSALLGGLLIPDRTTMIAMYVSKNITYERVCKAAELGKNLKDEFKQDAIDLIEAMKGEEKATDGEEKK